MNIIPESLKRFLSTHNQRLVRLGWRTKDGRRTSAGKHAFLNFLEFGIFDKSASGRKSSMEDQWKTYVLETYKERSQKKEDQEDPLLEE